MRKNFSVATVESFKVRLKSAKEKRKDVLGLPTDKIDSSNSFMTLSRDSKNNVSDVTPAQNDAPDFKLVFAESCIKFHAERRNKAAGLKRDCCVIRSLRQNLLVRLFHSFLTRSSNVTFFVTYLLRNAIKWSVRTLNSGPTSLRSISGKLP